MDLGLFDETVVVVGGAHGIGWSIANEFAKEGAHVAILDRAANTSDRVALLLETCADNRPNASAETETPAAIGTQVDITDFSAVQQAVNVVVDRFHDFRHVVIASGTGSGKYGFPFWNLEPTDWQQVIDVNLMGIVNVAHAVQETLRRHNSGSLTLLASVAGQIGSQTDPPYSASKAGVINFGQCMAKDFAPYGIRVNTICPGMVQTQLSQSVWQAWNDLQPAGERRSFEDWASQKVSKVVPLQRWQSPEDIAALCVFLASKRGQNITGQTMNVDGGYVMHS